jgi:hypothetical protein
MPDPVVILKAMGTAAVVTATVLGLLRWPWRRQEFTCVNAGWAVSVTACFQPYSASS